MFTKRVEVLLVNLFLGTSSSAKSDEIKDYDLLNRCLLIRFLSNLKGNETTLTTSSL